MTGNRGKSAAASRCEFAARQLSGDVDVIAYLSARVAAPLLRSDEARHAAAVETARGQLDDATWRAAWEDGCATPPEELVAHVLEGKPVDQ